MRRMFAALMVFLAACSGGEASGDRVWCSISGFSAGETVLVDEGSEEEIDLDGQLRVRIVEAPERLTISAWDISGGERDMIATWTVDVPHLGDTAAAVTLYDGTYQHPTNRRQFGIRCVHGVAADS